MTRLVHLTDLHFGMHRQELVGPLRVAVRALRPDVVVVSGDLAHRARTAQFRQAMAFLDGLQLPFLAVPGNHDLPLFNLARRFMAPLAGWRREVRADVTPGLETDLLRIVSSNTADPFRWRRGRFPADEAARVLRLLRPGDETMVRVLACHHPFREPPGFERGETRGAEAALPGLAEAGLDIILSGHLHRWSIGTGISEEVAQPVVMVQTGTALCARPGETGHGFSELEFTAGRLRVTPWTVDETGPIFRAGTAHCFRRQDGLWRIDPAP